MISNYPSIGFTNGISLHGIPFSFLVRPDSKVFWVDSVTGADSNSGDNTYPFATLSRALNACISDRGDQIYVSANHSEDIDEAGGIVFNKDGVTIIFVAEGGNKGTINFTTATDASITWSADNVTLVNPSFTAGIDGLTAPLNITGANSKIIDGEWHDGTSIGTVNAIIATAAATNMVINGWTYYPGTAGTAKATHIQLTGAVNPVLKNIKIAGDFSTANINLPTACSNGHFDTIYLSNLNATPKPGMAIHADSTFMAKNVDIKVVSGSYVSDLAKGNWDNSCLGYIGDGYGGDPLGTAASNSIEGAVLAIKEDVGDPSARTNFQSLETMIGIPDAANSNLDDIIRSGYDSTAIVGSATGSLMEMVKDVKASVASPQSDLYKIGTCDVGMAGSTTTIVCAGLGGAGDDIYNDKYYMEVLKNDNSVGAAPEREIRKITDYVSATGTFTTDAFSVNVEASDKIAIMEESLVIVGRDNANNAMATTNVVANADGSLVERDQYNQEAIAAIQTDIGNPSARTNFQTLEAMIGIPDAANSNLDDLIRGGYDSTADTANLNGGVIPLLKYLAANTVPDLSGLVFSGKCDAAMGASTTIIDCAGLSGYGDDFFNNKYYMAIIKNANGAGAAPEREIRQITDYTSTTGRFTTNAFSVVVEAADDIMLIHETLASGTIPLATLIATINTNIGDPSGDTLTSITAKLGDGATTVYAEISKIDSATLAVNPTAGSLARFVASGGTALGNPLADSKSLVDALGTDGTNAAAATAATAASLFGAIGTNEADATTPFASNNVQANADGTVLERQESIQVSTGLDVDSTTTDNIHGKIGTDTELADRSMFDLLGGDGFAVYPASAAPGNDVSLAEVASAIYDDTNAISGAALPAAPTANSLAAFIASGGTALGTELADSKSIVDALGTDGTDATAATGAASATSVLGAIGTNETDVNTPFSSAAVEANADGTVLERQEAMQASVGLAVDSTTTDNVHGKIGTDTEMADRSVFDLLGGDGFAVYPASAAPGNDVSLAEVASAIYDDTNTISGAALPAAPTANSLAAFIASGGTALGTELADSKSIVDAIGSDGTTLSYGSGSMLGAIGTVFWIKKTMVSSTILSGAPVDITGVSSGGELAVEDIILKTDQATGLAGGTNLNILTNNSRGQQLFAAETVANLGPAATVLGENASVLAERTVLETGKKFQVQCTGVDCTGPGEIDIYIKLRRLSAGATVSPT